MIPNDRLEVHFLNVDHGDCTIIRHPGDEHRKKGRISLVDINDFQNRKPDEENAIAGLSSFLSADSTFRSQIDEEEYAKKYLDDPIDYFQSQVAERNQDIWRFICTHPDMDHISGLNRLGKEENVSIFWDTTHSKDLSDADYWPPEYDKQDWERYEAIRNGDTSHQHLSPRPGSNEKYWKQDQIEILHPTKEFSRELDENEQEKESPEYNDISYILKLNARRGAILLPGDAEQAAWDEILDRYGPKKLSDVKVLKASHHGRKDGFHKEAVEAMNPEYVIVSVGTKDSADAHQKYARTCSDETKIWSTRQFGTISFTVSKRGAWISSRAEPDGIFNLPGN